MKYIKNFNEGLYGTKQFNVGDEVIIRSSNEVAKIINIVENGWKNIIYYVKTKDGEVKELHDFQLQSK